jgi:hypothetical protein
MNFLKIDESQNLGFHPISINDLNFIQNGVFEVATTIGILAGLGTHPCIIGTLNVVNTGSMYQIAAPIAILYNGHLYPVSMQGAAISSVPNATLKFELIETIGVGNPVTYKNGATKNVHFNRTARLVHTHATGGNYKELSLFFSDNQWLEGIWTSGNGLAAGITTDPSNPPRYRYKIVGTTMFLHIIVPIGTAITGNEPYVTLPFQYRAKANNYYPVHGSNIVNTEGLFGAFIPEGDNKIYFQKNDGETWTGGTNSTFNITGATLVLEITI